MQFTPKTSKQIAEMNILPPGEYPFEVASGEDAKSKKGRDMIVLDLYIFLESGSRKMVTDYLVPGTDFGDKKIFEFAHAAGLKDQYESGNFSAGDCAGRTGYLVLGIDKWKKKDNSEEFFPDRNAVKYYVSKERKAAGADAQKSSAPSVPPAHDGIEEDSAPF